MKIDLLPKSYCLLFFLWVPIANYLGAQPQYATDAQQLLESAITKGKCAGIAAGFSQGDEIIWTGSAGKRDLKSNKAFEIQTLNRIASVTKTMTAVAVLQLYEREQIDLDVPIQTYLPDFPIKTAGAITVRQLLQHTSGIDGYRSEKERENKTHYASLQEAVNLFQDRELVHPPGTEFHYTTYGYVLLGRVIESVSDMSFADYLRQNIWQPAGMEHIGIEKAGQQYDNKSALYHLKSGRKIKTAKPTDLSDRIPGGGLHATVEDLLKFGQAILSGKLLQEETVELMWQDAGLKEVGNGYGMGWYLYGENPVHGPVYGHNGAQTGASTFLMLLPERETVIAVLSNTSGAMQEITNITIQLFDTAAMTKED